MSVRDRGHRNSNERGNTRQRHRRRQWLLDTFGDGEKAPCVLCGVMVDNATMIVGRIIPWIHGGTYAQDNIRPECALCSCQEGQRATTAIRYGR